MEMIRALPNYVRLIIQLFYQFEQYRKENDYRKQGGPSTYTEEMFIIFFLIMQFRRIYRFKAQHRWLMRHPEMLEMLGWAKAPHRTTISRRYKALYETVQAFALFISKYAPEVDECFRRIILSRTIASSKCEDRFGTNPIEKLVESLPNCVTWTRMPPV